MALPPVGMDYFLRTCGELGNDLQRRAGAPFLSRFLDPERLTSSIFSYRKSYMGQCFYVLAPALCHMTEGFEQRGVLMQACRC